ncbi:bifunctional phosphopantothenoylcysteine decarboxylase/phosphopantothenate--cysteine ligase CoaBC, partial [bacterium]
SGSLACGEEGEGRMEDISRIIEAARFSLTLKDLSGHNILVTAGPTREPIDPVRFVSNRSSGKMGFAIATAASRRGADVTLISGPTEQKPSGNIRFIPVERAVDMEKAVRKNLTKASVIIMTAAVSDFSPAVEKKRKIPKTDMKTLELVKTPDILGRIGKSKGNRLLIGFAAESGNDIRRAKEKLRKKNLDLIIFNDISREGAGFDTDTNIVTLIGRNGKATDYPLMKKEEVAQLILDKVVALKKPKGS